MLTRALISNPNQAKLVHLKTELVAFYYQTFELILVPDVTTGASFHEITALLMNVNAGKGFSEAHMATLGLDFVA